MICFFEVQTVTVDTLDTGRLCRIGVAERMCSQRRGVIVGWEVGCRWDEGAAPAPTDQNTMHLRWVTP